MKKTLFIIGSVLLVLAVGFFVWWLLFGRIAEEEGGEVFNNQEGFGTFFENQNGGNNQPFFENELDENGGPVDHTGNMPILRQISNEPIAGYTTFVKDFEIIKNEIGNEAGAEIETEERNVFRFIERGTGHVYETNDKTLSNKKISNTTFQKINRAIFFDEGQKILMEKLSDNEEGVDSFIGEIVLNEEGGTGTLSVSPFSIINSFFSLSNDGENFYYFGEDFDSGQIFENNTDFDSQRLILDSPIKDWLYSGETEDSIFLVTKPSSGEEGYGYLVNKQGGNIKKILDAVFGLTAKISPGGEYVLYAEGRGNVLKLFSENTENGEGRPIQLSTLPEKCVFGNLDESIIYCGAPSANAPGEYPDDWYQGQVSFRDSVWRVDLDTGEITALYFFESEREGVFDIVDLTITEDEEFLLFKNKRDLTLWSLDLGQLDNTDSFNPSSPEDF